MKRRMLVSAILPVLILAVAGAAQAWQGRMGGMGDPYGLISDEADFLIHPAKIATGEGIRFYGDYRFLYRDMFDNDIDVTFIGTRSESLDLSGAEEVHDALVGAALPLGPGRMGLLFTYEGRHGDLDGEANATFFYDLELMNDLDDFDLRLLYGTPVGAFKLGGELGIAYRQEEHEDILYDWGTNTAIVNILFMQTEINLYAVPSCAPYDSAYWEIPFKAGIEGAIGPLDVSFTLRGGWIIAGDNTLTIEVQDPIGVVDERYDLDGDVEGWRVGGNLWARYPLAEDLVLPVLVRVDYQEKARGGDWQGPVVSLGTDTDEQTLAITIGGGAEWEPLAGTRLAAGIYYSYLRQNTDFFWSLYNSSDASQAWYDCSDWPDAVEHRGTIVLAGERELSPTVTLRMGLSGFFGWAAEDQQEEYFHDDVGVDQYLTDYATDGFHWGIGASLGATMRFAQFAFEPFVNGGYQRLDLEGDGGFYDAGVLDALLKRNESRSEWYVGGGMSILFDL